MLEMRGKRVDVWYICISWANAICCAGKKNWRRVVGGVHRDVAKAFLRKRFLKMTISFWKFAIVSTKTITKKVFKTANLPTKVVDSWFCPSPQKKSFRSQFANWHWKLAILTIPFYNQRRTMLFHTLQTMSPTLP